MKTKEIREIEVVPYNPAWSIWFKNEADAIKRVLGDNFIAIHHVGSTAVPGLSAKPRIDIIAVLVDPKKSIPALESIGYEYRGEWNIPFKFGFRKRGKFEVNLHVYEEGHPEIESNLLFRDYLRKNSKERDEYQSLKETLLKEPSSFEKNNTRFTGYTLGKGDYIRKVLSEAGFKRIRLLKCSDETEWKAAKYFRQTYFFDKAFTSDPYTWTFNHVEHEHLVLYQGTEIIGYAHIQFWPDNRAALRIILIDESVRHHGLGGQFLSLLENWLKSKGINSLHTESSPEALKFYKKHDYVEMPFNDPEEYGSHTDDIPMGKIL
jgi:GrpB-like predicted nucleotidyltransferase (UPF0157 family)/GNAT superfamily N-acetyltransferase